MTTCLTPVLENYVAQICQILISVQLIPISYILHTCICHCNLQLLKMMQNIQEMIIYIFQAEEKVIHDP